MFDIGWTELLVIGVVALIVVGPQDLPRMFRTLGKFTAKARAMAREFQTSLEEAAEESGVSDITKDIKAAASMKNLGLDAVKDAVGDMAKSPFDPDEIRRSIAESGENTAALAAKRDAQKDAAAAKATDVAKGAKPAAKKPAAKKSAAKKPAAKKPAAKKPAAKKAPAKKPAAKKPAAKKPAAAKPAAKKTAAKSEQ